MRFAGKVAIVTGAASGIGTATALRLAAEGASVILADIQDGRGEAVASEIRAAGGTAFYYHCDVSVLADWHALADRAMRHAGHIDIVHNNAYTEVQGPTHELDERVWDRQIAVCLNSVFLSVKTCMPHLLAAEGVMINTSSVHALFGFRWRAAYGAAKGAICALTRELAAEYGPTVRVNAVVPGAILTQAWNDPTIAQQEEQARQIVARRLGRPEEVAAAVCFLASSDASYITGTHVVVDGGWSIWKE